MPIALTPSSVELQIKAAHHAGLENAFALKSTITQELDVLPSTTHALKNHLVVSPYTTPPHLLDLSTVSSSNRLLSKALTKLIAIRPDYATAPYIESFNWEEVISHLRFLVKRDDTPWIQEESFYIVAFRSQILPETVREDLGELDRRAHAEAMASGGFFK